MIIKYILLHFLTQIQIANQHAIHNLLIVQHFVEILHAVNKAITLMDAMELWAVQEINVVRLDLI